jgi:hypothetical protein
MGRRWFGLALGALTIAGGAVAHAEDPGCCEVECHDADASGASLRSLQRRPLSQTECESRFPGCVVSWRPEACAVGGEMGIARHPDDE